MKNDRLKGVIAAAATPLRADYSVDLPRLAEHCRGLLSRGCDGINLLGTTGEATSFSTAQRLEVMNAVAAAGLPLDRFMVGTGAAALADAVRLTSAARDLGFAGALLLPPFYYKNIDGPSLVAYVEAVIDRVGPDDLKLYLYHFPQLSGVPYAAEAVERLHRSRPGRIAGLKDSSGDLSFAIDLKRRLPDLDVFPSAEGALAQAQANGFAGCISATVNVTAPLAAEGWKGLGTPAGALAVEHAAAIRRALTGFPVISCVKWALADLHREPAWSRLCPPLRPLAGGEIEIVRRALADTGYAALRS